MDTPNTPTRGTAITIFLASTLTVMSGVLVAPALPKMQQAFQDVPHAELLVPLQLTLPALILALFAPFAGWIVDRFGRKRLLAWSCLFYAVVGVMPAFSDSIWTILCARAALGLAEGAVFTVTTTLISDYYDGERRRKMLGLQAACMAAGGIVFISAGGVLADFGWHYAYPVYGWAIVLVPMVVYLVPEPSIVGRRHSGELHAGERLSGEQRWQICAIYGLTFAAMLAFYVIPVQTPYLLIELGESRASMAGAAGALGVAVSVVMALLFPRIVGALGESKTVALTFALLAVGMGVIGNASAIGQALLGIGLAGMGGGLLMPNMTLWLNSIAPAAMRGRLNGGLSSAVFLSQFACPLVMVPLAAQLGGLRQAFVMLGAAMGLLVLLVLAAHLKRRHPAMAR